MLRCLPAVTLLIAALIAVLPFGADEIVRYCLSFLPLIVIHYWSARRPTLLPVPLIFAVGLAIDVLTHGPVGYWALLASLTARRWRPRDVWLTGHSSVAGRAARFLRRDAGRRRRSPGPSRRSTPAQMIPARPFLAAALACIALYPLMALGLMAIDRLWETPRRPPVRARGLSHVRARPRRCRPAPHLHAPRAAARRAAGRRRRRHREPPLASAGRGARAASACSPMRTASTCSSSRPSAAASSTASAWRSRPTSESYRAVLVPSLARDVKGVLARFARIVPLAARGAGTARGTRAAASPPHTPLVIAPDLTFEQIAAIGVQAPHLPGVVDGGRAQAAIFPRPHRRPRRRLHRRHRAPRHGRRSAAAPAGHAHRQGRHRARAWRRACAAAAASCSPKSTAAAASSAISIAVEPAAGRDVVSTIDTDAAARGARRARAASAAPPPW